jgi:hypothetical protein
VSAARPRRGRAARARAGPPRRACAALARRWPWRGVRARRAGAAQRARWRRSPCRSARWRCCAPRSTRTARARPVHTGAPSTSPARSTRPRGSRPSCGPGSRLRRSPDRSARERAWRCGRPIAPAQTSGGAGGRQTERRGRHSCHPGQAAHVSASRLPPPRVHPAPWQRPRLPGQPRTGVRHLRRRACARWRAGVP